jgi:hypothetical protein
LREGMVSLASVSFLPLFFCFFFFVFFLIES